MNAWCYSLMMKTRTTFKTIAPYWLMSSRQGPTPNKSKVFCGDAEPTPPPPPPLSRQETFVSFCLSSGQKETMAERRRRRLEKNDAWEIAAQVKKKEKTAQVCAKVLIHED